MIDLVELREHFDHPGRIYPTATYLSVYWDIAQDILDAETVCINQVALGGGICGSSKGSPIHGTKSHVFRPGRVVEVKPDD